ncbi:MAG: hypothetical protein IJE07_00770 [Clostridia bacterium]|nr:hypothetical protein [Clostridia bacterium]
MKMNENRASQVESLLKTLPQAAAQGLSGLEAGDALKTRIQLAAAQARAPKSPVSTARVMRWASLACCALLAVVMCFTFLGDTADPARPDALITSGTMGGDTTQAPPISSDLSNSTVHIRAGNSNPEYRDWWAPATNGNFPLIGVNGRYYRMLTTPRNVSSSLLGKSVGTITEFTTSPSLSGNDTVLSNVVALGETVYGIRGMEDTLISAKVDGQMRLFQRVSFNGYGRLGRESLEDTLNISGHVIAMELTGVGTITDAAVCQRLLNTLFDCATYKSNGSINSRQSLIIELDNGLVVQLAVKSESVAACGVWSCPEFFEEFEDACD